MDPLSQIHGPIRGARTTG